VDLFHVGLGGCDHIGPDFNECVCFSNCAWTGSINVTMRHKQNNTYFLRLDYVINLNFSYLGSKRTLLYIPFPDSTWPNDLCRYVDYPFLLLDACMISGSYVNDWHNISWRPK
jgi:hypothetical protein